MNPVLTVKETAAYLRTHPSTIYRLLKRGELPAFRVGSDWRFLRSQIEAWSRRNDAGVDEEDGELSTPCFDASRSPHPASRTAHERCNGWCDRVRETECTCWCHAIEKRRNDAGQAE